VTVIDSFGEKNGEVARSKMMLLKQLFDAVGVDFVDNRSVHSC